MRVVKLTLIGFGLFVGIVVAMASLTPRWIPGDSTLANNTSSYPPLTTDLRRVDRGSPTALQKPADGAAVLEETVAMGASSPCVDLGILAQPLATNALEAPAFLALETISGANAAVDTLIAGLRDCSTEFSNETAFALILPDSFATYGLPDYAPFAVSDNPSRRQRRGGGSSDQGGGTGGRGDADTPPQSFTPAFASLGPTGTSPRMIRTGSKGGPTVPDAVLTPLPAAGWLLLGGLGAIAAAARARRHGKAATAAHD